jgi:hypothetical protein
MKIAITPEAARAALADMEAWQAEEAIKQEGYMEFTDVQSGERITYTPGSFNNGATASYPATYRRCLPLMDAMLKEIYRLRKAKEPRIAGQEKKENP